MTRELHEQVIRRYLLGQTSDAEEQRMEEQYFADDSYFEHMLTVEEELIDGYVSGSMTGDERKRFEKHFISSPQRRQRVAFAQALLTSAGQMNPARSLASTERESQSWWRSWLSLWRIPQPVMQALVLAGFVLIAAAGSLSVMQNQRLRDQIAGIQAEGQSLRQQVEQQRTLHQQLNEALDQERIARGRLEQNLPIPQQRTIASFILTPGAARSSADRPPLLIRPGTDEVHLQLDLETEGNVQYRVAVRTADDQEIWSQDGLRARRTATGGAVVLSLPANLLLPGDYLIMLRMVTASGDIENAGQYSFRTMRR